MRCETQHLLAAWTKWRLVDAELDAAEWRGDARGRAALAVGQTVAVPRGEAPP
jgi:hypothetical protein